MPSARKPSTPELLLELLETLSFGAITAGQAAKQLRRRYPLAGLGRRVATAIGTLEAEGLVESGAGDGPATYHATPSGLAALETRGRFPGTTVVMFTDLADSTELIGEFGEDGAHQRRQRHFALLRGVIAKSGGHEVKNLGDGLMVVFSSEQAAIDCALAMQRSVARDRDRLGLRIGLHAGEVLRDGNDFFGTTVIVAGRLCDHAEAGQTIASDETFAAAGGHRGPQVQSLGALRLKGLTDAIHASLVTAG